MLITSDRITCFAEAILRNVHIALNVCNQLTNSAHHARAISSFTISASHKHRYVDISDGRPFATGTHSFLTKEMKMACLKQLQYYLGR